MYTRSPAAYDALRSFKLLQLPSVRTLKYYIDSNLEEAGEVEQRLAEKKKQYDHFIDAIVKGKQQKTTNVGSEGSSANVPLGEGVLIIDEVKVSIHYTL